VRGVVRRNAEEDLLHDLVHQRRPTRRHAARRGSELGFGRRSCARWIGHLGSVRVEWRGVM
jgi:hypothetical protein